MHLLPAVTSKVRGLSIACLGIISMLLTGCQSVQATTKPITAKPVATVMTTPVVNTQTATAPSTTSTEQAAASTLPSAQFTINGKIGMTTPQQAGSAFYIWTQQGQNFAIEIAGAMNAGQTKISYNGQSATLTNEKGTINAATPEELLLRATGWQAPISQLPYWIQGQPAPSDANGKKDSTNRLVSAQNGDWTATFSYSNSNDKLPSRLTASHPGGYKVVMTINRLS